MVRSILVRREFRRISKLTRPGLQRLRSVTGSMDRILCIASDAVIRYLLEIVARDGAVGVSIPLRPDGSLDEGW